MVNSCYVRADIDKYRYSTCKWISKSRLPEVMERDVQVSSFPTRATFKMKYHLSVMGFHCFTCVIYSTHIAIIIDRVII